MTTRIQTAPTTPTNPVPSMVWLAMGWSVMVALASTWLAYQIFSREAFDVTERMGNPVQVFLGLVALLPAVLSLLAIFGFYKATQNAIAPPLSPMQARAIFLLVNYVGMVLSGFYLLHVWEVFVGMDAIAGALYDHSQVLWVLVIIYGLTWLANRFDEDSPVRGWLETLAVAAAGLALIIFLVVGDGVGAVEHIVGKYGEARTWLVTAIMVIFGVMAYNILHLGAYFGETTDGRVAWQGWLMLSPNAIGFMLFFAGPLLFSLYLSFTDAHTGSTPKFIGLRNYGDILALQVKTQTDLDAYPQSALDKEFTLVEDFTVGETRYVIGAKDQRFWASMRNTILFCLMLVPMSTIPAIGMALVLDSKLPGMKFYRALYFLPSVAAVVGTALIWRTALYSSSIGFINYGITEVITTINDLTGLGIKDPQYGWLSDPDVQLFSVVLMTAWQVVGFNTVLFLAGLQGIPKVLYEASAVDGANNWQRFWRVTLPLLGPTTFFVVVTTIISGLQVFNEVFVLFTTQPVPEEVTTGVMHLYRKGFFGFEFGYASAVAWIIFALIFLVTIIQFRVSRSNEVA